MSGSPRRSAAPDQAALSAQLEQDAAALGLGLSAKQIELLIGYLALMARWNATYNLTAIRDPAQMLIHHIVDSLAIVPEFACHLQGSDARIMDVGSGGGLPGVVLAIVQPRWHVLCVDAVEKKTAFVRQVAGTLQLDNLKASHARVETLPAHDADIVTSRAFASLADFTSLAGFHVKPSGRMAAMKGQAPDAEITALPDDAWQVEGITPITVPRLDAQRCLVWLRRPGDEA